MKLFRYSVVEEGAFGVLLRDDLSPIALTLERTFENLRVVIPDGVHRCTRTTYHKGGYETYEIEVEGHKRVLLHRGNTELDSLGCVLVGTTIGYLGNKLAVLGSAAGFGAFLLATDHADTFDLEVRTLSPP